MVYGPLGKKALYIKVGQPTRAFFQFRIHTQASLL